MSLSFTKRIFFIVLSVHLLCLFSLCLHHFFLSLRSSKPSLKVHTFALLPTPSVKPMPSSKGKKSSPPSPLPMPLKPKRTLPPKATSKVSSTPSFSPSLLHEIKESFAAIESTPRASSSRPSIPTPLKSIQETLEPIHYESHLIAFLQSILELPEQGEVKAKIELDRYGRLLNCEIVASKSKKNEAFLKERLPQLSYPLFTDFQLHDYTATFEIRFKNR